jgi:hypothetical protein
MPILRANILASRAPRRGPLRGLEHKSIPTLAAGRGYACAGRLLIDGEAAC